MCCCQWQAGMRHGFAILMFLAGVMTGCKDGENAIADSSFHSVNHSGWRAGEELEYVMLERRDSSEVVGHEYVPVIVVRHSSDYEYSDLRLVLTRVDGAGREHSDTVKVNLYDEQRNMSLGRGYRGLYEVSDTLAPVRVEEWPWRVSVSHAMSGISLKGVNDIGIIFLQQKD